MGEFSITHILLVLAIVLIFFGPSRLPGLGASLGKAIRGFKDGIKDLNDETPSAQTPEQLQARQKAAEIKKEEDRTRST